MYKYIRQHLQNPLNDILRRNAKITQEEKLGEKRRRKIKIKKIIYIFLMNRRNLHFHQRRLWLNTVFLLARGIEDFHFVSCNSSNNMPPCRQSHLAVGLVARSQFQTTRPFVWGFFGCPCLSRVLTAYDCYTQQRHQSNGPKPANRRDWTNTKWSSNETVHFMCLLQKQKPCVYAEVCDVISDVIRAWSH